MLENCCNRKVYLGFKKKDPLKKYAIKVVKKADIVNKNLVNQGKGIYFCISND